MEVAADPAPTTGNAALLERLVHNLVDNATRYDVEGGWVRVESFGSDGAAVLQAAGGAGLGVSIVRAVANAHGGVVDAVPRPGGGLVVSVVLPGGLP